MKKLENTKFQKEIRQLKADNSNMSNQIAKLKNTQEYQELVEYKSVYEKLKAINLELSFELESLLKLFADNDVNPEVKEGVNKNV